MRVITRHVDESFFMGEGIQVTVLEIDEDENEVRLGITDPHHEPPYREEVLIVAHAEAPSEPEAEYALLLN